MPEGVAKLLEIKAGDNLTWKVNIKQFYNVNIDNTSVLRRVQRFATEVAPFVDKITPPHLSGIYHVDEMMVHVRRENMKVGHYQCYGT